MTILTPNRRRLITGLVSLVAAPAIVRAASLMPVRALRLVPLGRELHFGMVNQFRAARGLAVSATYSIDGAPFAPCAGAVTELEHGIYAIALTPNELRGEFTMLHFTAAGADPTDMIIGRQ